MENTVIFTYTASITQVEGSDAAFFSVITEWDDDMVRLARKQSFDALDRKVSKDARLLINMLTTGIKKIYPEDKVKTIIRDNMFDLSVVSEGRKCKVSFAETLISNLKKEATEEQVKMLEMLYSVCREYIKVMEAGMTGVWQNFLAKHGQPEVKTSTNN